MTSSSIPSARPVMSSSVSPAFPKTAEKRMVTTVGVVARYIMTATKKVDPCDRYAMLTELRPAVRAETDWKKAFQSLSLGLRSLRAADSESCQRITAVVLTFSVRTTRRSQRVCTAGNMCVKQRRGCSRRKSRARFASDPGFARLSRHVAMSRTMIGRQVLPRRIRDAMVFSSSGLLAKSMTEEGVKTRPLFWNEETVRYMACQ
mmetsp:Transcript_61577/g.138758  ORF Transcript_61577/g.138758 Transcript_61577/m.138758 type:complete len:204 (-) Transcript_61577:145-756(-)